MTYFIVGEIIVLMFVAVSEYAFPFLSKYIQSDICSFLIFSLVIDGLCAFLFVGSVITYNRIRVLPRSDENESNMGLCVGTMISSLFFLLGLLYLQIQSPMNFVPIVTA